MATVTQSNIGTLQDKISVTISTNDYLPQFNTALKSYAKNANIPGFRKGMVPAGMVKKMYGANIYSDEVLRSAGNEVEKYLSEKKLQFFGRPLPVENGSNYRFDMNAPQDYTFDFEIGLQPNFTIPALDNKATIEAYKVIVTDEMINEEVEKMRYRTGKMNDLEVVANEDDVINVTFLKDGATDDADAKKSNSLLIKYFSADAQAKLMGKKIGESVSLVIGTSFDEKLLPAILKDLGLDPTDETAKLLHYTMTIDKIAHVEKAAVEVGMFEDIYPNQNITTEEEFRAKVKTEIQGYWDIQGLNKLHNDMYETLVHETPIELPVPFLKRWLAEGGEVAKPMEEVEKDWSSFEHSIRWQLISEKIVKDNELVVNRAEIEQGVRNQIKQYFAQMGMGAIEDEPEWMQGLVEKQLKDKKATEDSYNQIMTDKLFKTMEEKFNVQFKDVTIDEFAKAPSKHHHHH